MAKAYLDWNASAPLRPEARAAILAALDEVGNPSSIHRPGRAARRLVEQAREQVAQLVGAEPKNVIFTSGGTEANMLALTPAIELGSAKATRNRLLISAIEHSSVRSGGRFVRESIEEIRVSHDGIIDLSALESSLSTPPDGGSRALVSLMLANNESGVIQPVKDAAAIVHAAGALLHVDAVQGPGRIPSRINDLQAELLTISAHKLGGPKGVGALIKRSDLHLAPLITGGGQERGLRAGTENVAGIVGFGAAAEAARTALSAEAQEMAALRDQIEAGIRAICPAATIFGADRERLPNTTLFTAHGLKAETAVIAFDLEGVAVSSGAACSSGKVEASHVLAAMGVPADLARGAIRVSLGPITTKIEIEAFLGAWAKLVKGLYKGRNIAA